MPKISVVLTTYNRPEKLKRAIQSVIDQTFQDWELIVVDDHSTPAAEIPNDKRIRLIRLPNNTSKHAIPKNIGTEKSAGEYLAYLDNDNTWRPDHLQILYNELTRNPDLDLVYGDRWVHDETGTIKDQLGIYSEYSPKLLLIHNYIDTSDFLVKRQAVFDIGGWDERYRRMADWNLLCRLAKNGCRMKRVPVIITDYNLSADSISHEPEDKDHVILWNPYEVEVELPYLKEVKEPTVAVFTVIHKEEALPIAQKCLPELRKRVGYPYYHVVVLNGVLPKTKKWLEEYRVDHIIENQENLGIAAACNQAVDYLKDRNFDIIWKVDADMLAKSDDLLKVMVELYKKNHMMVWSAYPEGLIDNAGGAPRIAYGTLGGHLVGMTAHIGGFCQFIPTKARVACRLPETKVLHFMEDLFMSQGVAKLGYGLGYIEDIRVQHLLKA